jgi:hypothetical protein
MWAWLRRRTIENLAPGTPTHSFPSLRCRGRRLRGRISAGEISDDRGRDQRLGWTGGSFAPPRNDVSAAARPGDCPEHPGSHGRLTTSSARAWVSASSRRWTLQVDARDRQRAASVPPSGRCSRRSDHPRQHHLCSAVRRVGRESYPGGSPHRQGPGGSVRAHPHSAAFALKHASRLAWRPVAGRVCATASRESSNPGTGNIPAPSYARPASPPRPLLVRSAIDRRSPE